MIVMNLLLPTSHLDMHVCRTAANDPTFGNQWKAITAANIESHACKVHVRLLRRAKEQDCTRFALTGKLSDVCAALDELAALEQRNACRCACL